MTPRFLADSVAVMRFDQKEVEKEVTLMRHWGGTNDKVCDLCEVNIQVT